MVIEKLQMISCVLVDVAIRSQRKEKECSDFLFVSFCFILEDGEERQFKLHGRSII